MRRKLKRKLRQKMASHAANQKRHAFRRFKTRHDIDLTWPEYNSLIMQIQTGKSLFVGAKSGRVKNHLVVCRGHVFIVGYDKFTKQIRTVLPVKTLSEIYT